MAGKEKSKNKRIMMLVAVLLAAFAVGAAAFFGVRCIILRSQKQKTYDVKTLTAEQVQAVSDDITAKKLMIVAHPDDETLWGAAHLMSEDYFVLCITNGRNKTRKAEFEKMLERSGNSGYILEYPDKVAGKRDDWAQVWEKIDSDVERIMTCKDWELIVTHNKDGEYGHQQHKYTHSIVTQAYDKNKLRQPLYCFGEYYSKAALPQHEIELTKINDREIVYKTELANIYGSQKKTVDKLWHMAPYEMWTLYEQSSENMQ